MSATGASAGVSGAPASPVLDAVARLERFYGPLPAPPADPFRAYVWEVLSTQTTAVRRDAAYAALLRIPALTPDAMFRAARAKLVAAVSQAGAYGEQRLHALLLGVERFRRHPRLAESIQSRRLRDAVRAVSLLPRVGDGAAHRVLLNGGGQALMPVDRDVTRLATRLGWAPAASTRGLGHRVRRAIERGLPVEHAALSRAALYLRHHAQHTCTDEPHCAVCPLSDSCASSRARTEHQAQ